MKHFFLTGASGNIGSALVPKLLKESNTCITILLRADDQEHLEKRFAELVSFWGFDRDYADRHLIPRRGDMTQKYLGMDQESYTELVLECSHIIHCGGVVRMNLPLAEARKSALDTAQEIVRLAQKTTESGNLEKIEYISTVGVIGNAMEPLTEKAVTIKRTFHNTYEEAKAEAEEFLLDAIAQHNLPLTIHRPSMVVGAAKTGKAISFQVFYHLCEFLAGGLTLGILPNLRGATLDIVPVDYVAKVIAWSAKTQLTSGKFLHECTGPNQALKITELEKELQKHNYFRRQKRLFGNKNMRLPIPFFKLFSRAISIFLPPRQKKALNTLPFFLKYLGDPQSFGNRETDKLLKTHNLSRPAVGEFLPEVLNYYIKIKSS